MLNSAQVIRRGVKFGPLDEVGCEILRKNYAQVIRRGVKFGPIDEARGEILRN